MRKNLRILWTVAMTRVGGDSLYNLKQRFPLVALLLDQSDLSYISMIEVKLTIRSNLIGSTSFWETELQLSEKTCLILYGWDPPTCLITVSVDLPFRCMEHALNCPRLTSQ